MTITLRDIPGIAWYQEPHALPWADEGGDTRCVELKIDHGGKGGMTVFVRTTVEHARKLKKLALSSAAFDVEVTGVSRCSVADHEIMSQATG